MWLRTVEALIKSRAEMALVEFPDTRSLSISRSRSVKLFAEGEAGGFAGWCIMVGRGSFEMQARNCCSKCSISFCRLISRQRWIRAQRSLHLEGTAMVVTLIQISWPPLV